MSVLVTIVILAIVIGYPIVAYNGLVSARNRVKEAWSDIETQLKRRYDLIPNLIASVKGYMQHESSTLEKIVAARSAVLNQGVANVKEAAAAENQLSGALKSIFALSESYPELKANQNFLELQRDLRDTEDKIQAARRFYNGNVLDYNTQIQQFPKVIIAGMFHFEKETFFELDEAEKKAASKPVEVKF
jgi:LemA protein